ncbi:bifunctional ADP-dependent NAD(P)H-hydrate dehydratase/NAD(P)H-hydrate epimerase [Corynebacterium auris]|uniref:bifunctional ADP-dependent NAD(P)H-hydrate dehydratase/NAD(P)H-hydrate epimerase n=1 Tax=Corynebacterium auris TaxID=44750 RepID=UPI0025B55191|nr:bifunctional ADP-dependent NAD(P)H-hydrate dehydratase/NAD(P)H-hydrate epimerase [Corynebacterium auris]WJY69068.1 Bifunctional NAD(P)H-hydrate repair enzyme Nnr [Corynebacterium auris]
MFHTAYTAEQIRAAEKPLISAQSAPDELMKQAAHAAFRTAEAMLGAPSRVLLLVGKGGNGADALYAGAELALAGHRVDAWCVFGTAHSPALEALRNAGGRVLSAPPNDLYDLLVDGVVGLGGSGSLPAELERTLTAARQVLAIDVPSGIDADTGEAADVHVVADVTVTFGGWRLAHALAPECGTPVVADIGGLSRELRSVAGVTVARATCPQRSWPDGLVPLGPLSGPSLEPGARDDKYSGGVVGIRAGSSTYPGAAILCVAGAVAATSAMVRYAGPQAIEVVRAHPEVVAAPTLEQTGRVQAWVYGPGAGTDDAAARELASLLAREEPVLIDADGLTLLAEHEHLRHALRERRGPAVVTPHDGEAKRLASAVGLEDKDRLTSARELADRLGCTVVRKGRSTIIAEPNGGECSIVEAGNSWAATPGSGDVLAGVAGARMARGEGLLHAVQVHAAAAKLAAATPYGEAPTSASAIAAHVRSATALLSGAGCAATARS